MAVRMRASRPFMPGYGIVGPDEGSGLLPWSWALDRLIRSHDFWLTTVWPDGRPHVMPVWGVWLQDRLWFSSSLSARKARNLAADPRCCAATDNALEPVIVQGRANRSTTPADMQAYLDGVNEKYGTDYTADFLDPAINGVYALTPEWVFGLTSQDFAGSPTRWVPDV